MKRSFALLAFFLVFLLGCGKEKPPATRLASPSPNAEHKVILATTVDPASAFKMDLTLDPAQPLMSKKTRFRVKLADTTGAPVPGAQVRASLVMPLMDMGKNEFALTEIAKGEYEGSGQFTMAGEWEAIFTAQSGARTAKTTFNLRVED